MMRRFATVVLASAALLRVAAPARAACDPTASPRPRIVGYFTSWGVYAPGFEVADIDAAKLTHVNYAFANVDGAAGTAILGDEWADVDRSLPGDCAANGCLRGNFHQLELLKARFPHLKVLISIGGWTWSDHFSDVALTPASRQRFVQSALDLFIRGQFGAPWGTHPGVFDGVDIDWEYPVAGGMTAGRAADRANFTLLMQEFRTQLDALSVTTGRAYELSFAAGATPDAIVNLEVPALAAVVDHVNVMTYDFHGTWESETGFNSPLHPATGDPSAAPLDWNVEGAVDNWLTAGLPPSQLVVGMPFYGHSWSGVRNRNQGLWQPATGAGPGLYEPGFVDYNEVVSTYLATMTRSWQAEAMVPWLFDGSVFIGYDDPQSIAAKASFVAQRGLGGAMIWELSADIRGLPSPPDSLLSAIIDNLCPAVTLPAAIVDLRVARTGNDLLLTWTPDANAPSGYHLYQTDVRPESGTMRDTVPGYDPCLVVGASPVFPVIDTGGVASGLTYYQILGVASDGVTEGPN